MGDLKYREYFTTTLPSEQLQQLRELSKKTMIPISRLVEDAIKDYLKKQHTKKDK